MAMMAALTRPTAACPLREEGRCGWMDGWMDGWIHCNGESNVMQTTQTNLPVH